VSRQTTYAYINSYTYDNAYWSYPWKGNSTSSGKVSKSSSKELMDIIFGEVGHGDLIKGIDRYGYSLTG
jgi:hypothetical protein